MPSQNRSDKWDRTMKASVNPRKEKSRNPSNLGGFGMANHANLDTDAPHLASRGAFDRKVRCIKAIYHRSRKNTPPSSSGEMNSGEGTVVD